MLGFSCRAAKISFAVAFVIICISAVCAQAQGDAQKNAVLNSPYLAKAGACMNNMTAAGKSAGFETDRDGGAILIKDPKNEKKLGEILSSTFECLDNAFGMTKTAAIMKRCSLFITNDSSLMHIAAALKLNVLALLGPTNKNYIYPWQTNFKIASLNLDCSPCFFYSPKPLSCLREDVKFKCITELSVEKVYEIAKEFLG